MVSCKVCKNLSKLVIETDNKGNIVKYKPNTCKVVKKEIYDIGRTCFIESRCSIEI